MLYFLFSSTTTTTRDARVPVSQCPTSSPSHLLRVQVSHTHAHTHERVPAWCAVGTPLPRRINVDSPARCVASHAHIFPTDAEIINQKKSEREKISLTWRVEPNLHPKASENKRSIVPTHTQASRGVFTPLCVIFCCRILNTSFFLCCRILNTSFFLCCRILKR